MDWLGISLTRADLDRWLLEARDFVLPRLLDTLGQVLLGAVLFVVARWVIVYVEKRFTSRTRSKIDDHIVEAVRRVASVSIVMWVLWRTADIWTDAPAAAQSTLVSVVEAVWIIAVSVPLAALAAKLLLVVEEEVVPRTETTLDDTALPLLNKFARFMIVGGAAIMALAHIGVQITPFIAGASVAGVAIGLAAKDTLSNLIAGVLLIMDRPFEVGDRIELWDAPMGTASWGDVVEIGLRATRIRNPDNVIFVIPNNLLMQRDIVNWTASGANVRLRIPIGIAYDADPAKAKEIITKVALETPGVIAEPPPQVIIRAFGESAVDLELRVWIQEARRRRAIMDEITDRVKSEFDRAGVEIPYAKRDLYIRSMPAEFPATLKSAAAPAADRPEHEGDHGND
jgi:small-conductance mechanosensitive channel